MRILGFLILLLGTVGCSAVPPIEVGGVFLPGGGATLRNAPVVPGHGVIFSRLKAPMTVDPPADLAAAKKGMSSSSYFNFFISLAWGDISVKGAAANGNISSVTHVDYESMHVLGIFGRTTVTAYGN